MAASNFRIPSVSGHGAGRDPQEARGSRQDSSPQGHTSVNEERFRSIANLLTTEGYAPSWFADIEYITWSGKTKNLIFVDGASPEEILLVDDYEKYVHPGQENQWIKVPDFDYPYSDDDLGLGEVLRLLRIRVAS